MMDDDRELDEILAEEISQLTAPFRPTLSTEWLMVEGMPGLCQDPDIRRMMSMVVLDLRALLDLRFAPDATVTLLEEDREGVDALVVQAEGGEMVLEFVREALLERWGPWLRDQAETRPTITALVVGNTEGDWCWFLSRRTTPPRPLTG